MAKPTHTLLILFPNGSRQAYFTRPELGSLQAAVGGTIETIPGFKKYEGKRCTAYCHEEGKIRGQEFNLQATGAWIEALGGPEAKGIDWSMVELAGQVVVVIKGEHFNPLPIDSIVQLTEATARA